MQVGDAVISRGLVGAGGLEEQRRLVDLEPPWFLPSGGRLSISAATGF